MFRVRSQRRGAIALATAVGGVGFFFGGLHAVHAQQLLLDPGFEPDSTTGLPSAANGDVPTSGGNINAQNGGPAEPNIAGPWWGWNNWTFPYAGFYTAILNHTPGGSQAAKSYSGANGGIYQNVAVTPGQAYTASVWFYDLSSDAINYNTPGGVVTNYQETEDVQMTFYGSANGSGTNLGTAASPTFNGINASNGSAMQNTWYQYTVTAVAPVGAQSLTWMSFFQDPQYQGGAMYLDDASLIDTTWNGGGATINGANNWSDPNNWNGVALAAYGPVTFGGTVNTVTNNDTPAGAFYYGISFTSNAGSFVLNGNELNLNFDVVNNSPNTQTINLPLGLGVNVNFNTAAGNMVINGSIAGAFSITKQGPFKLTLAGSNTYTGQTIVNAGTLEVASATALPAGDDLLIAAGASVVADKLSAPYALSVGSLSVAGQLDLSDNAMIVHNSSLSSVFSALQSGYNNGAWNGSTGIVSSAAAADSKHLTALGVIINDTGANTTGGTGTPIYNSLDGATTVDGDILVKYTYYGDANLDGTVDASDYSLIDNGYLNQLTGWYNGDFNYDGVVNGSDYTLIDNAFNMQGASLAGPGGNPAAVATTEVAGPVSVPEPATLGLLAIGALRLLSRRRK